MLEASDGEAALALLDRERPVIIFSDVQMPNMDGVEFLTRLRAMPEYATLPVIMVSSVKERELVLKLVELRITDYIVKPIDLEQTFRRLERLLPALLPVPAAADRA